MQKFLEVLEQIRFRFIYMVFGFLIWLVATIATGAGGWWQGLAYGGSALATVVELTRVFVYMGIFHITMKGLLDYVDREEFYDKAKKTPEGAGLALIGNGLFAIAVALVFMTAITK